MAVNELGEGEFEIVVPPTSILGEPPVARVEAEHGAAAALLDHLRARGVTVATAESCTGGLIAAALTAVAGSSDVVDRGFLREGQYADLVLVEDRPLTVERGDVLSKCGWSPFDGHRFKARIDATWVNGKLVYRDGALRPQAFGQRIAFHRH